MSHFGGQLAAVLELEKLSQAEFAHQVGLQATYLNRLLKTSRPISPATAARIIDGIAQRYRASLVTAFLQDVLEQLDQCQPDARSQTSTSYSRLVSITEQTSRDAPVLPARVQQRLNAFARFAEKDSTLVRALEAFLEAMFRVKS